MRAHSSPAVPHDESECVLKADGLDVASKTGTTMTSVAHLLTTMLGLGVMALSGAMGALGWIAGSCVMLFFFLVTLLSSHMLLRCYEVDGQTHPRYYEAVDHLLGHKWKVVAAWAQLVNIWLTCIAYSITAAQCMKTIATIICDLPVGIGAPDNAASDSCFNEQWAMALIYGGWMMFVVQLRDIESSWIISTLGACSSFIFSFIAIGLCIDMMSGGNVYGRAGGIVYPTTADKVFNCMNALGSVGFAWGFCYVQLEVHDTVKPPAESKMRRACNIAVVSGGFLYTFVAIVGYMAFGQSVPSMLLNGFSGPGWLLIIANIVVLFDMTSSFNMFSQALFLSVEQWCAHKLGMLHPAEAAAIGAADEAWAADKLEGASVDGTEPKPQPMPAAGDNPTVRFSGVVLHTRTFQRDPSGKRRPRVVRTATPHPSAGRGGAEYAVRPLEDVAEGEQLQDGSLQDPRELRAFVSRIARNGNLKVKVHAMAGPWRMESALRCRRTPELALKPWRRLSARTLSFLLRAAYVWICVAIAVVCPFFGSISGLIGAVAFWPLQVLLPTLMVLKIDGDNATAGWKRALLVLNVIMAGISCAAVIGSFRGMIVGWEDFSLA